jgi:uncharacterized membrane protein YfcA
MKPAALTLNVLVASIATIHFTRAGCFSPSLFWPFAATSLPFAMIGGSLNPPARIYNPLVALVLLTSAVFLILRPHAPRTDTQPRPIPLTTVLASGSAIGLLSGLTGTGGGIFLAPLLLLTGWAQPRESAGITAPFNLVNSVAALSCLFTGAAKLPGALPLWALAAVAGALIGSTLGARHLGNNILRVLLAAILAVAAVKLLST